jgi:hypothetical protein
MATPIFSNSIIGEVFEKLIKDRENSYYPIDELLSQIHKEIQTSIRNYFFERKCICDKNINDNVCEKCFEDNMIEKDLIGVFRIAK